ncbi:hypothetical protein V2J09_016954 [Rumex salicifolius]
MKDEFDMSDLGMLTYYLGIEVTQTDSTITICQEGFAKRILDILAMASSTTGERRWGSARRGGMTVLGKVAVPKPINLPSQRLENHGVDPSVEIVPKGSLSWGTRSSSSGSNAWGSSSALSPRTEGGSGSPSHLSGRPSSSGGTRPSTAGSERNLDTSSNVWIANSRPSSASRVLSANTSTLAALRPHSAENRPGSSQLSRFAEPLSEGTAARGASGALDKLGVAVSSNDGFSLSSGDFPILGEEKVSEKNTQILDCDSHSRPGSSGLSPTTEKMEAVPGGQADDISHPTDVKGTLVNSWENDAPHPGMERWHGDSYPYPSHNFPSHPYESWRGGRPVNPPPPGGVWFRGPQGVPPYGTPQMAAAGGFPMEPFPYYCPQVPAPSLANAQAVPPHGARPSGPHSQSGDLCRPYIEPFMRPGMPMRPGFYPGYYGQPMGFHSPNERDFSIMGRPTGPPVINKYPNQNAPEPITSNARSSGGRTLEQVDLCPPQLDHRATAPVKQIMGWDKNIKEDHFGHKFTVNAHPHEKRHAANSLFPDNVRSEDPRQDKQIYCGKRYLHNEQAPSLIEGKTGSTDPAQKYHGNTGSAKSADVNHDVENVALPRDQTLIQKIEGLNAKVRASDGKHDISTKEPNSRGQAVKSNVIVNEAGASVQLERHYPSGIRVPVSRDRAILPDNKGFASTADSAVATVSRHSSHNLQGRGGNGTKGTHNFQEADGWRKRSATAESRGIVSVLNSETTINIERKENQSTEMSTTDREAKDNSKLSILDPSIGQHVNMKEITKQRAIQLQREEEERIREQKAKANAKLAELNRRSANQEKEISRQKMDDVTSYPESFSKQDGIQKQDESKNKIELQFGSFQSGEIGVTLPSGYNLSKTAKSSASSVSSGSICSQTNQQLHQVETVPSQKILPAVDDAQINDTAVRENSQVSDISKQKGAAYKQKYAAQSGTNQAEKPTLSGKDKTSATIAALKEVNGKGGSSCSDSNLRVDLSTVSDTSLHTKRKSKTGKNKHMVDESFSVSSASVQKESDVSWVVAESMKLAAVEQKSHKSDAVVWAPVKSHAKMEVADGNDKKAYGDSGPANRNNNAVPSSSKGRRAEIERYIPKAAIKELAQQGSDQLSTSPSIEKSIPDGTYIQGRVTSQTTERIKRTVESKHVENKTKQWHQRTSTASDLVQVSGDNSLSMTGRAKNSQTSDGAHQTQKSKENVKGSVGKPVAQVLEVQPSKQDEQHGEQQIQRQEDNAVDGWVIYDEPVSSGSAIMSSIEDHGKSTRGKKNPYKGNKGSRNQQNMDPESHAVAKDDTEYFAETGQAERPRSSKEHRVAQWQPRPQTRVTNQHENHPRGRPTVIGEGDKIYRREGSKDSGSALKQHNQDTEKNSVLPQNYSVAESRDVPRVPNTGSQESKSSSENRSYSPNENTLGDVESAPQGQAEMSNNDQRPSSSGNRWNGNYNGRPSRGREFHGARSFIPQENRHNHAPSHREKQRQNSRYEYQPVGPYNRNKRGENSERQSENQHAGTEDRVVIHNVEEPPLGGKELITLMLTMSNGALEQKKKENNLNIVSVTGLECTFLAFLLCLEVISIVCVPIHNLYVTGIA